MAESAPDVPVLPRVAAFLAGRGDRHGDVGRRGRPAPRSSRRVAAYLRAAAPLAVLLEDLHAADAASLRLLEHLAAAQVPGLLLVGDVPAARGLAPDLGARPSGPGRRRADLPRRAGRRRRPRARHGHDGDRPGRRARRELRARTAGNPFFVTALARESTAVPSSVGDVVRHRVERLGEPAGSVLESAAVIGDEAEAWLVAEVAGRSLDETVTAALEAAYEAGLVTAGSRPSSVRFTHSLVVDALLDRRSTPWKAARHLRCATALTRARGDREDLHAAIARHWLAAAELGPDQAAAAAEFCGRAARSAVRRLAHEDAVTLWEEAIAADALAGSPPRRVTTSPSGSPAPGTPRAGTTTGSPPSRWRSTAAGDDPVSIVRAIDAAVAHGIWIPFRFGTMPEHLPQTLAAALARVPDGRPDLGPGTGV